MHELGLLKHIGKIVEQTAVRNGIEAVRFITLEIGDHSGVIPQYMEKLFPMAAELFPSVRNAVLKIDIVRGSGLVIREIGY